MSELKYVVRAGALLDCGNIGVKIDHTINKKEPFSKRRIENDIALFRKDLIRIDDWFKERWKNGTGKLKFELKNEYKIKAKSFNTVTEELKQSISTKALKLKRHKSRVKQSRQKRTFKNNKKTLYEELDGKMRQGQVMPDEEESIVVELPSWPWQKYWMDNDS